MTLDRRMWLVTQFTTTEAPAWSCPSCDSGALQLDTKTLQHEETAASRRLGEDRDWDPTWDTGRFTATFRCTAAECGDVVVVCGDSTAEERPDAEHGSAVVRLHRPRCMLPAPPIIRLVKAWPEEIREHLVGAFSVFWQDLDACANRVRAAVEVTLTRRGVMRFSRAKGRRHRLTLHQRIELFGKLNPGLAEMLMAVKWIGNSGSHDIGAVRRTDILDGFELLEHVLSEIFERRSVRLKSLARRIHKKKGPISK